LARVSLRGAYSIIEGREQAAVGAHAVVLARVRRTGGRAGALPLASGTLVGFVGHIPTNPTSVDRGPSRTTASGRAAATLFPSVMQ
jgi:hypothetical protein